jgi:hypothetical protein
MDVTMASLDDPEPFALQKVIFLEARRNEKAFGIQTGSEKRFARN